MASDMPNLFASLYKWAKRQDENYCTEGLIYLMRLLLAESPDCGMSVIRLLTNGLIGQPADRPAAIQVVGQVVSNLKRPDVQVSCGKRLAWIEVKVDSPVAAGQLANYRRELQARECDSNLALLWRGGDPLPDDNRPDHYVRWVEISQCLRNLLTPARSTALRYELIAPDYLAFLESRQLAMSPISSNVALSIQDMGSLLRTIGELLARAGMQAPSSRRRLSVDPDSPYLGYAVCIKGQVIGWIGVHLHEPQWLFFTTENHDKKFQYNVAIARQFASDGNGDMVSDNWTLSVDLMSASGLFSKEPTGQIDWLRENLLTPAVQAARELYGLTPKTVK